MTALRVALLLDPLSAHLKGGEHAHELGLELARRGHVVRAFGAVLSEAASPASAVERLAPSSVVEFAPDAIVAYDALSPAAWLGARAARRLRVPLLVVEAGLFVRGSFLERSLWRIGHSLWGAYVRRSTRELVALDSVARDLARRDGFADSRCRIVPHGVDPERFRPGLASALVARHRVAGRLLVCVTNHDSRSGIEVLIAAYARTLAQRADWSLVVAGRGPGAARARASAERLGIGARVHFLTDAETSDLPGLCSASTLFAEPTLDVDRTSLGALQALACGAPVLASKLSRLEELVAESRAGEAVAVGSVDGWSAAIARAAGSPDARERWSAAGVDYARERASWRRVADEFESVMRTARGAASDALPLAS
jgi:glycosyltransferase involved in cell wall biosynthesis